MSFDRKEYRMQRRSMTRYVTGRTKDEVFEKFFPGITERMKTNELINKQTKELNQNLFKYIDK